MHAQQEVDRVILQLEGNKTAPGSGSMRMTKVPELPSIYKDVVPTGAPSRAQADYSAYCGRQVQLELEGGCTMEFALDASGERALLNTCRNATPHVDIPQTADGARVTAIAHHAFASKKELESVSLPEGLELIGGHAFMETSISSIACPSTLREIGPKAFLRCRALQNVHLNDGLITLGESAFCSSGLASLHLPASLKHIRRDVFLNCALRFGDDTAPVTCSDGCRFRMDAQGCLYKDLDDDTVLVQLVNPELEHCIVPGFCTEILPKAFMSHRSLTSVELSPTVRRIGGHTFAKCRNLSRITLPEGLAAIGDGAFNETALIRINLPASIAEIGTSALFTGIIGRCNDDLTLKTVTIAPENPTFYMTQGLLCQKTGPGTATAIIYRGSQETVTIPAEVNVIGSHCFAGVTTVNRIVLHDRIQVIDLLGCAFKSGLTEIVIKPTAPGAEPSIVRFPSGFSGENAVQMSFWEGTVSLPVITKQADRAITYCQSKFQRAKLAAYRMIEPVNLGSGQRELYEGIFTREFDSVIREFALHGYTQGFDQLRELGFLTDDNISRAIEVAISVSEAKAVNHLISMRRLRSDAPLLDLDL